MKKIAYLFLTCIFAISVVLLGQNQVYAKERIEIKNIKVVEQSGTISLDELSFSDDSINSNITFNELNDFVTLEVELENHDMFDYKLESVSNQFNNENISIESSSIGKIIENGKTEKVLVKLTYSKQLENVAEVNLSNASIGFNFIDINQMVNPETTSTIITVILVLGMAITFTYLVKSKKIRLSVLLLLVAVPLMVYAKQSYEFNLKLSNVTVKGIFLDYDVIIYDEDGTPHPTTITYGEPIGELPEVPKSGYNFIGWVDQNGAPVTSETIVTKDLQISPRYEVIEYDITYDLAGGTLAETNPTKYTVDDEITLHNPTKTGYTFAGWSSDGGTTYQTSYTIAKRTTGNLNIVASFSPNQNTAYTVIHRKMNMSGEYETVETEDLHGPTGSPVTPQRKSYTGFITPAAQTKEIAGDGSTTFTYDYEREKYNFSISDRTYIDQTSTPDGEYYYDTQITIKATARQGYDFKWNDENTNLERTFKLSEETTLTPIYTARTDTPYTVTHKKMKLDMETYETVAETTFTGETDTKVTPAVNTYEGFDSPVPQEITITGNGEAHVTYLYVRQTRQLTINDSEYVETTTPSGEYPYGKEITLSAKDRTGFDFTGWDDGSTDKTITFNLTENKTIKPNYVEQTTEKYTITFDVNGGKETFNPYEINAGEEIGELPTPTRDGFNFVGWGMSPDSAITIDEHFRPEGSLTLYAKWQEIKPVCRAASELHEETCTNGSCTEVGYSNGNPIRYGKITDGTYTLGTAFDCNVDGDANDTYESRFYYLGSNGNNAVLVYYSNFEGTEETQTTGSFDYDTAVTKLPTTDQWANPNLVLFNGKPARFPKLDEVMSACEITNITSQKISTCQYLLENTRFVSTTTGRTGIWLEEENDTYHRIHTKMRNITEVASSSENVARPTIEVNFDLIDNTIDESLFATVTFDTHGGEAVENIRLLKGEQIGTLPETTQTGFTFDGWYTDANYTTEVTPTTVVNDDMTIHAKWIEEVAVAQIGNTTFETLNAAISSITTNELTTITLLSDTVESNTIPGTRKIILDLNNHTLSINDTGAVNVIKNNGELEVRNGTITSNGGNAAIDNNSGAKLTINNVTINMTGIKQGVYNSGGTATITGGSIISTTSTSERAAVHNLNSKTATGTMTILDATITSPNNAGLQIDSGVVTIGTKDSTIANTPVIQGETYGASITGTLNFYDGIIKGKTNAVDDQTKIEDIPDNTELTIGQDGAFETLTLGENNSYVITFEPNGGETTPAPKTIDIGDPVGELPEVTRTSYVFDGWWTSLTNGYRIDATEVPSGSVTYYAKWIYSASEEVATFDMTNDVMKVYYQNIGTWKNDQDTFQTNMDENFNNFNCSSCTGPNYQDCPTPAAGTTLCDQPKGYATGHTDEIRVYASNEQTKEIGDQVTYVTVTNGTIYNMIPGETYYWESTTDSNVHGYVKATGNRRNISSTVRNVRDIGGAAIDVDGDGTPDGTIKYGKIFRGARIPSSTGVTELQKLGITEEIDLRGASEGSGDARLSNYVPREITNYLINKDNNVANYNVFRQAMVDTMQDVIDGENIYLHCKIGTDRTGTMSYFLEGLLTADENYRLNDYELSYFYGLLNRHRFHDYLSGSSINPRFTTMYNTYKTNQNIYDYFMYGSTNTTTDQDLIEDFRDEMINWNSSAYYTVTLDTNDGSTDLDTIQVRKGRKVGTLPTPERSGFTFLGWYTGLTEGIEVDANYVPTTSAPIYARWESDTPAVPVICKKATTLHTETCVNTSNGCKNAGYTSTGSHATTTVNYGSIPTSTLVGGAAYDCDVNGDGEYNSENERFYYLRTIDDNAVLIFFSTYNANAAGTEEDPYINPNAGTPNDDGYSQAFTLLPTTTQWSNIPVTHEVTTGNTRAARLPLAEDIKAGCGITTMGTNNELIDCEFIYEHTNWNTAGKTAYWIHKIDSNYWRVMSTTGVFGKPSGGAKSNNSVKPVIEVPLVNLES